MTDVFVLGGIGVLGWLIVAAEIALSFWAPTRVFRVAVGAAAVGGLLGLVIVPVAPLFAFSVGAAVVGALAGAVCGSVAIIEYIERGKRSGHAA